MKKIGLKSFFILHLAIFIYGIVTVFAKKAASRSFFSEGFLLFFTLEILSMALYALLWQQAIKNIDLSVAYISKALSLIWAFFFGIFIFNDEISIKKIIGLILILAGVFIINLNVKGR